MTPLEKRVAELEMEIRQLKFENARKPAREAAPLAPRHGRFVGKTNAAVGAAGDVDVTVWIWSATDTAWEATATVISDVLPLGMTLGQVLAEDSSVYVFWYETTWCLIPLEFEGIVRFELTGTLSLTGHAPAETLVYAAGSWTKSGLELEVYDWYGPEGMWNGISGYQGFCVRRPDVFVDTAPDPDETRPSYDIIWMERIAQIVQCTSTEYMGASTASRIAATVNWYDHQGKDPGSSVTLRDPQGQFPDIHSGAKLTGQYDNHNGYYRVISSQRVALFAEAALTADTCASSMPLSSFAIKATGDYVGSPPTAPTTSTNSCGHAGLNGDTILLRRVNNTLPQPTWEVVDVEKHAIEVDVDQQVTGLTLQHKQRILYVEICDNSAPSWETWHTGDECA